jgi:nitrite reductase/ring-hydroxylating ferredoxin subunit
MGRCEFYLSSFEAEAVCLCQVTDAYVSIDRKEVDFEGGKVLLSKIGDKVHATSAFCTHYGAPLAKGVLVSDGRVVW